LIAGELDVSESHHTPASRLCLLGTRQENAAADMRPEVVFSGDGNQLI
jgi:hypothetical protein